MRCTKVSVLLMLSLIGAAVWTAAGCSSDGPPREAQQRTDINEQFGFALNRPAGWRAALNELDVEVVYYASVRPGELGANVNVAVEVPAAANSIDQLLEASLASVRQSEGYSEIGTPMVTRHPNGHDAAVVEYEQSIGDQRLRTRHVSFLVDGRELTFTSQIPVEAVARWRPVTEAAFSSIVVW